MQTPPFPDPQVNERIKQLAKKFELNIINIKYICNKDLDSLVRKNGDSKWVWQLAKKNHAAVISISFLFPSYISSISFARSSSEEDIGHFFLNNYLSDYIKSQEDCDQIQHVIKEKSWQQNWGVELDILEKHLEKDLAKIITGEEWPDIPFNWQDYVEPAALDRIYQDQKNILDEEVPGKPRNAWIYFLDHFRKK